MEYMNFPVGTTVYNNATQNNNKHVFAAKMYTWQTVVDSTYAQRFEEIICPTYPDGFRDTGLRTLFFMDVPTYKPLLVEFLTTFTADPAVGDDVNKKKLIHFQLCGQRFNMSLPSFARALGLVGDDSRSKRAYLRHLNEATNLLPEEFHFPTFWSEISNIPYQGSNSRESHLKDPVVRLVHRYLAWTLCFNHEANKCNKSQIYALFHCLDRNHRWHLPLAVAEFFTAVKRQSKYMPGGQFVTTIATNLGLLTDDILPVLGQKIPSTIVPLSNMGLSFLLKKVGEDKYEPYEIGDEEEVPEPEPRRRGKRTRRAPSQFEAGSSSQAPPPPEYTNRYVVEQNNILGHFVGELSNQVYQAELRSEMRYQHMLEVPHGPYAEVYHRGWERLTDWETRMASLSIHDEDEEEE